MGLLLRFQVVVSLLLAVLVFGAMGVGATFPGDELAFRDTQIRLLDMRTGVRHLLMPYMGANVNPAWSPDGKQIAFATPGEDRLWRIYVTDAVGGNLRFLAEGYAPVWSPDGQHIAFTSNDDNKSYSLDLATNDLTSITEVEGITPAAWSPDGNQYAYVEFVDQYIQHI